MDVTVLASGSAGNCYHISDGKTRLLLDAGIPIRRIRIGCKFRLHQVSGCLVTHCHGDHSKAVKDLLCACVPVYLPEGEAQALSLTAAGRPLHYPRKEADGYGAFPIGTFRILPFRVEHDTPEPVGYLIGSVATGEKLLYFTDTFYLRYRFTGLTHIIGECNYDDETLWEQYGAGDTPAVRAKRLFSSHMSLKNFLTFLDNTDTDRLRQIYICHMSDSHGNEARIREQVQRKTGAEVYIC